MTTPKTLREVLDEGYAVQFMPASWFTNPPPGMTVAAIVSDPTGIDRSDLPRRFGADEMLALANAYQAMREAAHA